MKIYTKTGDHGQTSLFKGKRVAKNHELIQAYGTVDELNAIVGMIRNHQISAHLDLALERVQNTLFSLGSDLATPFSAEDQHRFSPKHIEILEKEIDQWEQKLEPLKNFILPGGTPEASLAHLARTVCRRAERCCIPMLEEKKIHIPSYQYLNRLSDWLFVLARLLNSEKSVKDVVWAS